MASKSFAARLVALEALEATQVVIDQFAPPDLDAMDVDDMLWEAVLQVRAAYLRLVVSAPLGRVCLELPYRSVSVWNDWRADLARRATPLMDAMAKPIVLLAPWEADDIIQAIDHAQIRVIWSHRYVDGALVPADYELFTNDVHDRDVNDSVRAANVARYFVCAQIAGDVSDWRDAPQLTTLPEWRAWLVSIGEPIT